MKSYPTCESSWCFSHHLTRATIISIFIAINLLSPIKAESRLVHQHAFSTRTAAFASQSIPPPPPISVPVYSLAVATNSDSDGSSSSTKNKKTSMNIMTFCTAVSVSAPKLWALSLYKNTMTKNCFFSNKVGILQLLNKKQCHLVPILGKRSGYEKDYDKEFECEKIGYKWTQCGKEEESIKNEYDDNRDDAENNKSSASEENDNVFDQSIQVLPNCQSYIKFQIVQTMDAGDHEVALCQVLGVGQWDENVQRIVQIDMSDVQQSKDETDVLYTGYLRKEEII